jgi:hypothetical protein
MNKQALSSELLTRAGNLSLDKARKFLDAGDLVNAMRKSTQGGNLVSEGLKRGTQSVKALNDYIGIVLAKGTGDFKRYFPKKASIKDLPKDVSNMWTYLKNMDKTKWKAVAKHITPGLAVGSIAGVGTIALAGSPDEQGEKNYLGGALIGAATDLAVVGAGPGWKNRAKILPSLFKVSEHTEKTWQNSEARKQMLKATLDKTLSTLFEKNPIVDTKNKLRKADETSSLSKLGFKKHSGFFRKTDEDYEQLAANANAKKGIMGKLMHYGNFGQKLTKEKIKKTDEMNSLMAAGALL